MQTNPHASLRPLSRPRVTGRGPGDDKGDNDKPMSGGVSPILLSRISWCFKKGAGGILQKIRWGGGRREFRNVLRKSTKAHLLVTFQYAVLLPSLFDDVIFFFAMMEKIATKTFWKIQSNVSPVFLSFVGAECG